MADLQDPPSHQVDNVSQPLNRKFVQLPKVLIWSNLSWPKRFPNLILAP